MESSRGRWSASEKEDGHEAARHVHQPRIGHAIVKEIPSPPAETEGDAVSIRENPDVEEWRGSGSEPPSGEGHAKAASGKGGLRG